MAENFTEMDSLNSDFSTEKTNEDWRLALSIVLPICAAILIFLLAILFYRQRLMKNERGIFYKVLYRLLNFTIKTLLFHQSFC